MSIKVNKNTNLNLSAAVIGTVFVDCKGFSRDRYNPAGRNLGFVQFVHGGVGRNVAENLARMGVPVRFLSSVDDSGLGLEVLDRLAAAGAGTEYVARAESRGMGMWLAILDERGDLAGSISQMPDLTLMEQMIARQGEELVKTSTHLLLELDLNETIAKTALSLAGTYGKPVYGVPGNLEVVSAHPEMLSQLSCFICNHIEAERLIGIPVHALDEIRQKDVLFSFLDKSGLQSLVVTLGADGSVYADAASGDFGRQAACPVNVRDTSGAGDAFFSGTAMGLMRGLPLKDAVVCGTKTAGWTIESPENNCLELGRLMKEDPVLLSLLG